MAAREKRIMNIPMLYRLIILLLLVVIAYIPACQGDFIWDDDHYVSENPVLASPHGLWDIWVWPIAAAIDPDDQFHYTQFRTPQYYPLIFTTFWVEYRLWGLHPAGFHWGNVVLHGLNAGLLWLLLRRLRIPFPWFAAAIFALHPVHVESVAWITERKNVLSGFFYLIAFLAYLRFSPPEEKDGEEGRKGWYAVSLLAFVAALLSKSVTCSLPAVLVLVYWWKRDPQASRERQRPEEDAGPPAPRPAAWGWLKRREVLALIPMFAVGLVLALNTARIERQFVGAQGEDWNFTAVERCLIAGRALWFYVGKLLWPYPLIFNYERWHIDAHQPWQYLFPLGCLAVFVILAWPLTPLALPKLLMPLRNLGRGPLTACLIFAGTLFPALGFFNVYPMIYYFAADHFQYLASIAMICVAMAVIQVLGRRWPWIHAPEGKFLAAVLLLALGYLTWRQGYVYRNLDTLWTDTRDKNPEAWMAQDNFGLAQANQGNYILAVQCFDRAIQINPRSPLAYTNWGFVLLKHGREAESVAREAQKVGDEARARQNFAEAKRWYERALEKTTKAAECDHTNDPGLFFNMGYVYVHLEDHERAIPCFEKALDAIASFRRYQDLTKLIPQYENILASSLLKVGRREEALRHAQRAAELAQREAERHPEVEKHQRDLEKYNELVKEAQGGQP